MTTYQLKNSIEETIEALKALRVSLREQLPSICEERYAMELEGDSTSDRHEMFDDAEYKIVQLINDIDTHINELDYHLIKEL